MSSTDGITVGRTWQEELEIIDRTMRAISGITDPDELVTVYWDGIGELIDAGDYVTMSRRNIEPPAYLVTRSSRFVEQPNPWTERHKLPKLQGGLLGELIYGGRPRVISDLPAVLKPDDPAWFYLQGFGSAVALPQYDGGEALNMSVMLSPAGAPVDLSRIPSLHWQASLFGRGTQNLVLKNQLAEALAGLDRELQIVGEIQRSLLPAELPVIPRHEIAAWYQTSARAGGDYYDFFPLSDGSWGMFIGDVSGHGTPAAVLMAITHAIAHTQPGTHTPPPMLLRHLNDHLVRSYTREGTFVTAFYAVLNPATRVLEYATAGHNPPRLVRDGRVLSLDERGALPLGIMQEQGYAQATVTLQKGDLLLLYTDGITEAMPPVKPGERPKLFGLERLDRVLLGCGACSARECLERIRAEVAAHSNNAPATDDQTLVAIRCL